MPTRKSKQCKVCKTEYMPFNTMQKVCGVKCSQEWAKQQAQKQYRREARAYREKTKDKKSLLTEAQRALNAYIRIRDHELPCISCGGEHDLNMLGGTYDAGHWHGVGPHPTLRFRLWNIHKQCKYCNNRLSGNPQNYRQGLKQRFGWAWLQRREFEAQSAEFNHYSKDDLRRIKKLFNRKARIYRRLFRDC